MPCVTHPSARLADDPQGLNLLFYTLERAESMLPKGQTQFAVVADCAGFGPSKTPPLPMLKTAFVTMQRHYPMRLGYVVIVNAGGPIVFVWKVRVKNPLSPRHARLVSRSVA